MLRSFLLVGVLIGLSQSLNVKFNRDCAFIHRSSGLTNHYFEHVAHTVHSMTVNGLRMFNPKMGPKNFVPTVNPNISAPVLVMQHAPEDPLPGEYSTMTMRTIDKILSNVGLTDDGLGANWSPIERVVHKFHMQDLWHRVWQEYTSSVMYDPPSDEVCKCLTDVDNNGVAASVKWVAEHYKSGTPITLLGRPIPKLTDAQSWKVWSKRLLYYYTKPALHDSAMYMYCVTK